MSQSWEFQKMPDISQEAQASVQGVLQWVGMEKISLPLSLVLQSQNQEFQQSVLAKVNTFVSLDQEKAKGIHMSRLYIELFESLSSQTVTMENLSQLLSRFVLAQNGLSKRSQIQVHCDLPLLRKALLSDKKGWKSYPIHIQGEWSGGEVQWELGFEIAYSSTCPCSAALARQLVQDEFNRHFSNEKLDKKLILEWLGKESSIVATPHAQRSFARVKIKIKRGLLFIWPFVHLIDGIEEVLKTAVQTAVKREDEQEFARLNGSNLMFCEDSARKISEYLNKMNYIEDFWLHVEHAESLHAHNAVAINVKNIPNGYKK